MLSDDERALFTEAKAAYESLQPVPCTQCDYCMPCSSGVDIPGNFEIYNGYYKFGNKPGAIWRYNKQMVEEKRASACTQCNECFDDLHDWKPVGCSQWDGDPVAPFVR